MSETNSLRRRTFNGVIWNYINQFGGQVLGIIPAMILARLLTPTEYGVIAMAGVFSGLISIFANAGFGMAVIQRKDLTHLDICSVFYTNIALSTVVYIVIYTIAPFCAVFFNMPEVEDIMRVSSLGIIITSIGAIHGHLFRRELDFRKPTIRNLVVQVVAAVAAVILALLGFGYWALVVQGLVQAALGTIANWLLSKWRPTFSFSLQSVRSLFNYGGVMMLKSIFEYCFSKSYDMTIGKVYSAAQLSYFNRAYSTAGIFINSFLGVLNTVAFSAFSRMQADKDRLCTNVRRFMAIEAMIIFFIMAMIAALAEPFFHFMYSSKWDEVIPLFRLVCLWGMLQPLGYVYGNGLMASGYVKECLYIGIVSRGVMFAMVFATWNLGVAGMIVGQVVAYAIEVVICAYVFRRHFNYGFFDMVREVLPYFILSAVVFICTFALEYFVMKPFFQFVSSEMLNAIIRLIVGGCLSVVFYLYVNKGLELRAYCDFRDIVFDALSTRPKLKWIANRIL